MLTRLPEKHRAKASQPIESNHVRFATALHTKYVLVQSRYAPAKVTSRHARVDSSDLLHRSCRDKARVQACSFQFCTSQVSATEEHSKSDNCFHKHKLHRLFEHQYQHQKGDI